MTAAFNNVIKDAAQNMVTVYLVEYLEALKVWPNSPKLTREDFRRWMLAETRAGGAYGCDFLLGGLDGLVRDGHITTTPDGLMLTSDFVKLVPPTFSKTT